MAAVVVEVELPTERLEAQVCTLAGQIAAATCQFVLLVAELDRRETWRGWGLLSTAQWLSWKCGLSITAAREQVRVGRALESLPKITAAFAEGRLSFSKVRALVRVADTEREDQLIDFALMATAAQLERTIGSFLRQCGTETEERARLDKLRLNVFDNDDGMADLVGRLTLEQADLLRAALAQAEKDVPRTKNDSAESRRNAALDLIVRAFLAGDSDHVLVFVNPRGKSVTDHGVPPDPRRFEPIDNIDERTIATALGERFDHDLAIVALDQILNPMLN